MFWLSSPQFRPILVFNATQIIVTIFFNKIQAWYVNFEICVFAINFNFGLIIPVSAPKYLMDPFQTFYTFTNHFEQLMIQLEYVLEQVCHHRFLQLFGAQTRIGLVPFCTHQNPAKQQPIDCAIIGNLN